MFINLIWFWCFFCPSFYCFQERVVVLIENMTFLLNGFNKEIIEITVNVGYLNVCIINKKILFSTWTHSFSFMSLIRFYVFFMLSPNWVKCITKSGQETSFCLKKGFTRSESKASSLKGIGKKKFSGGIFFIEFTKKKNSFQNIRKKTKVNFFFEFFSSFFFF